MRKSLVLLSVVIAVASSAAGQPKSTPHASREAVITFLRHQGILDAKTRVKELSWDQKANW